MVIPVCVEKWYELMNVMQNTHPHIIIKFHKINKKIKISSHKHSLTKSIPYPSQPPCPSPPLTGIKQLNVQATVSANLQLFCFSYINHLDFSFQWVCCRVMVVCSDRLRDDEELSSHGRGVDLNNEGRWISPYNLTTTISLAIFHTSLSVWMRSMVRD